MGERAALTKLEGILLQLLRQLRDGMPEDWEEKCLYAPAEVCAKDRYALSDPCLLLEAAVVGDDLVEHLPPSAAEAGLELYCYGRTLFDVAESALRQRPSLRPEELLRALNYYSIHDSFLTFDEERRRPKRWNIGLFPGFSAEQLKRALDDHHPDFLSRGQLLTFSAGAALVEAGDSELISMCNLLSSQSRWALFVNVSLPSSGRPGSWSHHFYCDGYPSGPRAHPDDPKKQNQFRLTADLMGLALAFPGTEPAVLEDYLRSDLLLRDAYERWAQHMARRHRQKNWQPPAEPPVHQVRAADRYASDDYRQVFDFLAYLGFPLEEHI